MRRRANLRESRLLHAAVGATILAGPASAALADPPHSTVRGTDNQTGPALQAQVRSRRLHYGQAVVVTGHAQPSEDGQPIALDFAPAGSTSWQQIATGTVSSRGSFRLSAPLHSSGEVKVSAAPPAVASPVAVGAVAAGSSSTAPQPVAVGAGIRIRRRTHDVLGSRTVVVRGELLTRSGRHRVLLQGRRGGRWFTLAAAPTSASGRFILRYLANVPGQETLRVRFPGDVANAASAASAGRLAVFHETMASWYDDGGTTACGFHAYYGVANLSLPCGAQVSFSYGGRTVRAVVDDRGPYVGGREWDLNQNTAAALGFGGLGAVWSSQ